MLPNEREYRVGPQGYAAVVAGRGDAPNQHVRYEPGALVWLRGVPPPSADLQPTGRERRYETKDKATSSRVFPPGIGAYVNRVDVEFPHRAPDGSEP